jgi:hypothetical protein
MIRIAGRLFFFLVGLYSSLAAQVNIGSDSITSVDTAVSKGTQDTITIEEPLYRPASTIPPKKIDSATLSSTTKDRTLPNAPAANGRVLNSTDYIRGEMDGERDAKGHGLWFVAGLPGVCCCGLGLGSVAASFLLPPSPPEAALIGKSSEYIMGYSKGYHNEGRVKNVKFATLGCIVGSLVGIVLYSLSLTPSIFNIYD